MRKYCSTVQSSRMYSLVQLDHRHRCRSNMRRRKGSQVGWQGVRGRTPGSRALLCSALAPGWSRAWSGRAEGPGNAQKTRPAPPHEATALYSPASPAGGTHGLAVRPAQNSTSMSSLPKKQRFTTVICPRFDLANSLDNSVLKMHIRHACTL